jgi:hypothetical protein
MLAFSVLLVRLAVLIVGVIVVVEAAVVKLVVLVEVVVVVLVVVVVAHTGLARLRKSCLDSPLWRLSFAFVGGVFTQAGGR